MISKLFSYWNTFWFSETKFNSLGIFRIGLVSYLVFFQLNTLFLSLSWNNYISLGFSNFSWLLKNHPIPFPINDAWLAILPAIAKIFGVLTILGVFTRASLGFFTFIYIYLVAVDSAWGWHDHGPSLISQVLVVMFVSPGIQSLSLDRLYSAYREKNLHNKSAILNYILLPNVCRWGVQLIIVLVSTFYFTSGISKIRYGGLEWLNGHTLSFYLSGQTLSKHIQQFGVEDKVAEKDKWKDGVGLGFYIYGARPPEIIKKISSEIWLMSLASIAAVLLELLYPLVLFYQRIRIPIFFMAFTFHVSIRYLMGISFFSWALIDLILLFVSILELGVRIKNSESTLN